MADHGSPDGVGDVNELITLVLFSRVCYWNEMNRANTSSLALIE